jgi:hypothetical protein
MTTMSVLRPAVRSARPRVRRDGAVPLRLTARGRLVLLALALVVVLGSVLVGSRSAQADAPVQAPVVERHIVASGETLWGIAASIVQPDEDVRDVVEQLVALNHLPGSSLLAGQTIVVPVSG